MERKVVEDIMVPLSQYPHIKHSATLAEAIGTLERAQITFGGRRSLPLEILVFDDLKILVGLLRRRDIIQGLEPDFMTLQATNTPQRNPFGVVKDPLLTELSFDQISKGLLKRAKKRVFEVMQPINTTINHDDHIATAMAELVDKDVSFIPVLKGNTVVGVVRSNELLREIACWLNIKI